MNIKPIKTRIFREGDDLVSFIKSNISHLPEGSILVVTSKIVSLAENRTRVYKNEKTVEKIVKSESQWAMKTKTKYVWLTIKDNMVLASAGIDKSNGNGKIILLPQDSFLSAEKIRTELLNTYKIKKLGVIVSDSRLFPLRAGIVGIALGYSGFKGVRSYMGMPDIFGRKLTYSKVDVADSLATAAVLLMGEGRERQPLAVIKNAPVKFQNITDRHELAIDIRKDMYMPIFQKIKKINWKKAKT